MCFIHCRITINYYVVNYSVKCTLHMYIPNNVHLKFILFNLIINIYFYYKFFILLFWHKVQINYCAFWCSMYSQHQKLSRSSSSGSCDPQYNGDSSGISPLPAALAIFNLFTVRWVTYGSRWLFNYCACCLVCPDSSLSVHYLLTSTMHLLSGFNETTK